MRVSVLPCMTKNPAARCVHAIFRVPFLPPEEKQRSQIILMIVQPKFVGKLFLHGALSTSLQLRHNEHDGRLKSPASRLFTQPCVQAQIKENTKAPRHWTLGGEFTGDRWIPRTKGQKRRKWFHWMTSSCEDELTVNTGIDGLLTTYTCLEYFCLMDVRWYIYIYMFYNVIRAPWWLLVAWCLVGAKASATIMMM